MPQRTPNAKKAELEYRIVQETEQYIFFDITLHTGRHHQIRVQFSHMGCPILGDTKYGRKEERDVQLALCSYQLEFFHPVTQQRVRYELAPHNPVFENLIADSMTRNSGNT